jgi:hypothetical protein
MKAAFTILLLIISNYLFAQKADKKYVIGVHIVSTGYLENYYFTIIKNENTVKLNVYDKDTVAFNLNDYPSYQNLLDSVYAGKGFDPRKWTGLDGDSYLISVESKTINRQLETISPNEKFNPTIYHFIRYTFAIYRKLSKHPLVFKSQIAY